MSKSIWVIVTMAAIAALALSMGIMLPLTQFQRVPAVEWVRLAELTTAEFKLDNTAVQVNLQAKPTAMRISYLTRADSKFNLEAQNGEMEKVAQFAVQNYKGRELYQIEQVQITRSETHGSGCFQQTYVANFTLVNPRRDPPHSLRLGTPPPSFQPQER